MRVTNKLIREVVSKVAGEDVMPLVKELKGKKNVSEFKLAEKIGKEIKITRNILYRLYDANLVSFTRKKDKKKGWYIYYWTFNKKRIKDLVLELKEKRLKKLKSRLKREEKNKFYSCSSKCIRLDFDQAMEFEFKCPECGELVELEDNSDEIKGLKKEIKKVKKELKKKKK